MQSKKSSVMLVLLLLLQNNKKLQKYQNITEVITISVCVIQQSQINQEFGGLLYVNVTYSGCDLMDELKVTEQLEKREGKKIFIIISKRLYVFEIILNYSFESEYDVFNNCTMFSYAGHFPFTALLTSVFIHIYLYFYISLLNIFTVTLLCFPHFQENSFVSIRFSVSLRQKPDSGGQWTRFLCADQNCPVTGSQIEPSA